MKGANDRINCSENFHDLLKRRAFIYDTFEWEEQEEVLIPGMSKSIKLFKVGQIFANDGSSSDDPFNEQNIGSNGKRARTGIVGAQVNTDFRDELVKLAPTKDAKPALAFRG